uniref:Putative secreted protein n=1 Tax=Xenopsylla cheopis TaxID=163159 RepID=A0A6M2DW50_XENCH
MICVDTLLASIMPLVLTLGTISNASVLVDIKENVVKISSFVNFKIVQRVLNAETWKMVTNVYLMLLSPVLMLR